MEEIEKKHSKIKIGCILTGIVIMIIGILSLSIKIYKLTTNISIEFETLIPGIILLISGSLILAIGKNWNNLPTYIGKLTITISAFFLSGAIIILTLHSQVPEISSNVQPTIDSIIITYVYSEENKNIEILQNLLNTTYSFEILKAKNLSLEQNEYILETMKINQLSELSEKNKKELPSKIISSLYEILKKQNQKEILKTPIQINQIVEIFESTNSLKTSLLSISKINKINNEAEIIIMTPSKIQNENSSQNLIHIRGECKKINQNPLCEIFIISEYENIIGYISTNQTLPIEINSSTLQTINTIEKLEKELYEKTNTYKIFLIISIIFLLIGYALLKNNNSKNIINSTIITCKEINLIIMKYFILPTISVGILFLLTKGDILIENFQIITEAILGIKLPINLALLPIINTLSLIIQNIFLSHAIIIIITFMTYIVLKNKKKILITKELV